LSSCSSWWRNWSQTFTTGCLRISRPHELGFGLASSKRLFSEASPPLARTGWCLPGLPEFNPDQLADLGVAVELTLGVAVEPQRGASPSPPTGRLRFDAAATAAERRAERFPVTRAGHRVTVPL
jgi:hypothetical protein